MTAAEIRNNFYKHVQGATTPGQVREALANLPADGPQQIADDITAYCRGNNIDPEAPEILQYYQATQEYKTAENEKKIRAATKAAAAQLTERLANIEKQIDTAPLESPELAADIAAVNSGAAGLVSTRSLDRLGTWADYSADCLKYDPEKDFKPSLFCPQGVPELSHGLAFPSGTVSYIGGRLSRGKSTVLINLARDVLTGNKKPDETPRRVFFVTLEMSRKQLLEKLSLSLAYAAAAKNPETRRAFTNHRNIKRDFYRVKNGKYVDAGDWQTFKEYVGAALGIVEAAYNKTLFIYDGRMGARQSEIMAAIKSHAGPDDLVLLDYVQIMPVDDPNLMNDLQRLQNITAAVLSAAVETKSIIISGAQFNRGETKDTNGGDLFDDTSFRQADEIGQSAHNAAGIGWEPDPETGIKNRRFIEILKTREDGGAGAMYWIDWNGAYSYMEALGKRNRPRAAAKPKSSGNKPKEAGQKEPYGL